MELKGLVQEDARVSAWSCRVQRRKMEGYVHGVEGISGREVKSFGRQGGERING